MKIGKTKYLSLLDISSSFDEERRLIVQPLTKVYNEINRNAEVRIHEYQSEMDQTTEEVIDDETGTTSHDLLDGRIQDLAFEYDLQIRAASISLIIVAQSYLHSKFQSVVSAYEYFKTPYKADDLRNHYFSLGEKIYGVPWAEGVKAASNYIRHFEEWNVKSSKYEKIDGHLIVTKLTNLVAQLGSRFQGTPKTLMAIGFTEEQVFDRRNNISHKLVKALKLSDPDEFARLATVWIEAVMDDLHLKFDHLEKK